MPLKDLDREYRNISNGTYEERVNYCQKLITIMKNRLANETADSTQIRTLIHEIIASAEKEVEILTMERGARIE
jgi:hypothetical protein